jgi:hypothetical protein
MSEPHEPFDFEEGDEDPEIWDEYRWEEFMQESDKRKEKYSRLLDKYWDHPDRDIIVAKEMGWDWLVDALEAEKRGEIPEDDDPDDEFFYDEIEEGEEWKQDTGYSSSKRKDYHNLPVYQKAFRYGIDAHNLVKNLPEEVKEEGKEVLSAFVGSSMTASAKIAGGFGMGFDMHSLGGNIANCKRGLAAANRALNALQVMREKDFIGQEVYIDFYRKGKEVRDDLAVYIIELRERFERGVS